MNRRNVLKNLGLLTGGVLLFPSCNYSPEKAAIALNKLTINLKQENLLKEIVATLLPEGEIPGGVSLNVHNFVWVMIDDCSTIETQNTFLNGLGQFDTEVQKLSNTSFVKLDENERIIILNNFFDSENENSAIQNFLDTSKRIAISGYMNSEYIMTQQMPYKLVPGAGSYVPCKTINPSEKINING